MSEGKEILGEVARIEKDSATQHGPLESQDQDPGNHDMSPQSKVLLDEANQVLKKMDEIDHEEKENQDEPQTHEEADEAEDEDYYTRDLIDMTRASINFTKNGLFPGSVEEVEICIGLKEQHFADINSFSVYNLKVTALCNEAKFNDLDEYVFSVRKLEIFEYFEEVTFQLRKKNIAQVKVAVKIPAVTQAQSIEGTLSIQLANTKPVYLPITAKCEIPEIVCLKELYYADEEVGVIKIPGKKGTMRMPPIPFKNISNSNYFLELELLSGHPGKLYDVVLSSQTVGCNANSPFFINVQLKLNLNYKGHLPLTETIRKVLVMKIRNSSVHYSYPIQVYIYESSSSSSVS